MFKKEKQGCLLIHGFAGNTDEIAPMARMLEDNGYMTECPPLDGHSGKRKDLSNSDHRDWLASAEASLKKLQKECGKVVVIGFSMGGLIAANLAQTYDINSLMLLSTPYYYLDFKQFIRNTIADIREKKHMDLKRFLREAWSVSFKSMIHFMKFTSKTRLLFAKIKCPVFIGQGLQDDTVQSRSAWYIFSKVIHNNKFLKLYKNSRHQIFHGADQDEVMRDVLKFVNETH